MENGYIYVANNIFPSLLAISEEEQQKGLMFQPFPPPIMSFIYSCPKVNRFWMRNTEAPLDIVFCYQGEIQQICKGEPFSTQLIGDDQKSDLVIEFPYGTVKKSNIKLHHKVGMVKPTESELKKIIAEKYPQFVKF
jgi:uncharacterized membrane protein (UPF0127 family)